jgi:hypothetical protein
MLEISEQTNRRKILSKEYLSQPCVMCHAEQSKQDTVPLSFSIQGRRFSMLVRYPPPDGELQTVNPSNLWATRSSCSRLYPTLTANT